MIESLTATTVKIDLLIQRKRKFPFNVPLLLEIQGDRV